MSGQPRVYHGPVQGELRPLQYAALVVEPALGGAAARLGRWFVVVAFLPNVLRTEDEKAALGIYSAQSPSSVSVASPGYAIGYCRVKCSLCSVQQVWWSLH